MRRQKPEVLLPEEAIVSVVRLQIKTWILDDNKSKDKTLIALLPGAGDGTKDAGT